MQFGRGKYESIRKGLASANFEFVRIGKIVWVNDGETFYWKLIIVEGKFGDEESDWGLSEDSS